MPQILDALERGDILANETGAILARPAASLSLAARQERRRETAQGEQLQQSVGAPQAQLGNRQRMKTQKMVATLQRVASEAIKVQPGAARDEDPPSARPPVIEALEIVPPTPVLVDLIEYPEFSGRQLTFENPLAILRDVPIEVARRPAAEGACESRLTDLARAGNEHHLTREILADLRQEVARDLRHNAESIWVISP